LLFSEGIDSLSSVYLFKFSPSSLFFKIGLPRGFIIILGVSSTNLGTSTPCSAGTSVFPSFIEITYYYNFSQIPK